MEEGYNLTPIIIPLVTLLIGWAIGFFDSNLRTSKKIRQAEESAARAIQDAEKKIAAAQAKAAVEPEKVTSVDDPGLMRIKNENGYFTLDLDGSRINPTALTTQQRKRLIEMLNIIRPWLEGKPAPAPAPAPTPAPPPQPMSASAPAASPQPKPAPSASASTPRPSTPNKKKGEEAESAPTSIVGQINLILQARIVNTPLEARGVSLMESVSGGVNVFVGVNRYEAIDDVPDEEIKTAIRAAISEWENKYTPGLT